jgi:hypothetical protein
MATTKTRDGRAWFGCRVVGAHLYSPECWVWSGSRDVQSWSRSVSFPPPLAGVAAAVLGGGIAGGEHVGVY